jgi:hypothetical protein
VKTRNTDLLTASLILLVIIITILATLQHGQKQREISAEGHIENDLDKFITEIRYNPTNNDWGTDFSKQISFPSHFTQGAHISMLDDGKVSVMIMLGSRYDAVNKSFLTTDGKRVTVERFKIFLVPTPQLIPLNDLPVLFNKYESIITPKSNPPQITATLYYYQSGECTPGNRTHFKYLYLFLLISSIGNSNKTN